jgi:hypothetical protein
MYKVALSDSMAPTATNEYRTHKHVAFMQPLRCKRLRKRKNFSKETEKSSKALEPILKAWGQAAMQLQSKGQAAMQRESMIPSLLLMITAR